MNEDRIRRMVSGSAQAGHAAPNVLAALIVASALAACASRAPEPVPPGGPGTPTGPVAQVELRTPGGQSGGNATLTTVASGVEVALKVQGLAPGQHGFHLHMNGACLPGPDGDTGRIVDFGLAGGHFDPGSTRNHGAPGQPMHAGHAGDLPNVTVGADGRGEIRYLAPNLTVAPGPTSVMGRTLVVHANADDYQSDPAGNSGGRVLCGVVQPASGVVGARAVFEGTHVYPEGIAFDPASGTAYVGSTQNGDIFRVSKGATQAEKVQVGGSPGRQGAYGMKVDAQRRLWVAGGPEGTLAVIDPATATTLTVFKVAPGPQTFVNDLAIAGDGTVYVTDSNRPVVYRVRPQPNQATWVLEPWLDLAATPVKYLPGQVNLNGIVVSPDGRALLAIQSATGQLWRIDTATRAVVEVRVDGGELKNGDGLLLTAANELLVIRNENAELVRLALAGDWRGARVTERRTDPRLRYPTTAAQTPDGLWVVNAQLDKRKSPPPLLPFDVVQVDLTRR